MFLSWYYKKSNLLKVKEGTKEVEYIKIIIIREIQDFMRLLNTWYNWNWKIIIELEELKQIKKRVFILGKYNIQSNIPESKVLQVAHFLIQGDNLRQEVYF